MSLFKFCLSKDLPSFKKVLSEDVVKKDWIKAWDACVLRPQTHLEFQVALLEHLFTRPLLHAQLQNRAVFDVVQHQRQCDHLSKPLLALLSFCPPEGQNDVVADAFELLRSAKQRKILLSHPVFESNPLAKSNSSWIYAVLSLARRQWKNTLDADEQHLLDLAQRTLQAEELMLAVVHSSSFGSQRPSSTDVFAELAQKQPLAWWQAAAPKIDHMCSQNERLKRALITQSPDVWSLVEKHVLLQHMDLHPTDSPSHAPKRKV